VILALGIDIGTFESKGVLVDTATGRIVAEARHPHRMQVPRPGWAEHDPEGDWWGDTVRLCRALLASPGVRAGDIAAVAISAIGPCMVAVDADGAALTPGVLYGVDTRATAEVADLTARIGTDVLLARCGNALTSQSVGPKILWLKRHRPEAFARAATIMTSTSFVVMRLTGARVIDHYTAANYAPLYDVGRMDWVTDLDDTVGSDRLPRLMWATDIAGHVTAAAAAETGLRAGTLVTCGTIDAAAEAVSAGVAAPGDMMVMYGSTIFVILVTAAPMRDARLWYAPWLFPGQHASMAGLATSGTLTHWVRDQMARDLPPEEAFARLAEEAAASPPGANGLLALPYFSGERTPIHDPQARGALFGLNLTHTRGDIMRAVLEGIAMGTAHVVETYREAGQTPTRVLAVGGGTRNAVWLQATSDFAGLAQDVPRVTVGASFGDAWLAALGVGAAAAGDMARWNPVAHHIRPAPAPVHARHYALFRRLDAQTRDIAHALGAEGASP
jgi:xylulokinase